MSSWYRCSVLIFGINCESQITAKKLHTDCSIKRYTQTCCTIILTCSHKAQDVPHVHHYLVDILQLNLPVTKENSLLVDLWSHDNLKHMSNMERVMLSQCPTEQRTVFCKLPSKTAAHIYELHQSFHCNGQNRSA